MRVIFVNIYDLDILHNNEHVCEHQIRKEYKDYRINIFRYINYKGWRLESARQEISSENDELDNIKNWHVVDNDIIATGR